MAIAICECDVATGMQRLATVASGMRTDASAQRPALHIIVTQIDLQERVSDTKVPKPNQRLQERIIRNEVWLVRLVCPIVDREAPIEGACAGIAHGPQTLSI